MKIFDWQFPLWQQLLGEPGNLPHALLLAGPEGQGKLAFAQAMAARLLCEQQGESDGQAGMACGQCSSCTWLASGNHPDFRLVQPDEEESSAEGDAAAESAPARTVAHKPGKGTIGIDQIRALADFVFVGSHRRGSRVVVVSPAEAMTPSAANSLLKVLEEPPAGVYFILVSDAWRRLLPTIRSRCRTVVFGRPDPLLATQWLNAEGVKAAAADELLRLAGGAPLLAAEWAMQGRLDLYRKAIEALADKPVDPVAMAAKWSALLKGEESFGLPQLVETVQKWVFDLILLKMSGGLQYHQAWLDKLETLATRASCTNLLACYNDLLRIRAVARHPLNTQLFLEDMAARYLKAVAAGRA
jgi:DNA polymerase-3 subunit delta'